MKLVFAIRKLRTLKSEIKVINNRILTLSFPQTSESVSKIVWSTSKIFSGKYFFCNIEIVNRNHRKSTQIQADDFTMISNQRK